MGIPYEQRVKREVAEGLRALAQDAHRSIDGQALQCFRFDIPTNSERRQFAKAVRDIAEQIEDAA